MSKTTTVPTPAPQSAPTAPAPSPAAYLTPDQCALLIESADNLEQLAEELRARAVSFRSIPRTGVAVTSARITGEAAVIAAVLKNAEDAK